LDKRLTARIDGVDKRLDILSQRIGDVWKVLAAVPAGVLGSLGAIIASLLL